MRRAPLRDRPIGQHLPADGTGAAWWFDAGAIALDTVYTGPTPDDPHRELWPDAAALGAWIGERFDEVDPAAIGERELADARTLRAAVARAALDRAAGRALESADVDVINLFAATPDIPPRLAGGSRRAGRTTARVGQALAELAREAVAMLEEPGRIRACAAEGCRVVFYDSSRSANRRWCSMQRCGNRAKVRAHRARAAEHPAS
ncbi:MAG: CGNR zinc finger domain-containing protein [Microbacteriaceae bacterium]